MSINNLVVFSDTHFGDQLSLCPPEPIQLDGGGTYTASPIQRKLWEWWVEMWEWVENVTHGEPYSVAIAGDTMDGRHHGTTNQITQNLADQKKIALSVLSDVKGKLFGGGKLYMIRGTEAHVGPSGENEEMLAMELGAEPDEHGNYARNELWIRIGGENGALAHILHHIAPSSSNAYETTALMREYAESCAEAGRWHLQTPDFCVRGHRHRYAEIRVPTDRGYGYALSLPGWQLKGPFVWRIAGGRNSLPQCGGVLLRQGDEDAYTRVFCRNVTRSSEVVI